MDEEVDRSLNRAMSLLLALAAVAAGCEDGGGGGPAESTAAACADGADNDGDGYVDCDDMECAAHCAGDGGGVPDGGPPGDGGDADVRETVPEPDGADPGDAGDADLDGDAGDADLDGDVEPEVPTPCDEIGACAEPSLACYDFRLDGTRICAPRGRSCATDEECSPGTSCGLVPGWPEGGLYCLFASATCGSEADCPDAWRCEGGGCVDRRFTCVNNLDCPPWARCTALRSGLRACLPTGGLPACAEDEDCGGAVCVDVDGDGDRECQEAVGSCRVNADCAEGVCGDADGARGVECGAVGPCLVTADCPTGLACIDVDGDGALECQPAGGPCAADADCPERALCFDGDRDGLAECVS